MQMAAVVPIARIARVRKIWASRDAPPVTRPAGDGKARDFASHASPNDSNRYVQMVCVGDAKRRQPSISRHRVLVSRHSHCARAG